MERIYIEKANEGTEIVELVYSNGEIVKVKRADWVRATATIMGATIDEVKRDFGI